MTLNVHDTPDSPAEFRIEFHEGVSVKVTVGDHKDTDSVALFKLRNQIGHDHGVGRTAIVETRLIGIKSQNCHDTPELTNSVSCVSSTPCLYGFCTPSEQESALVEHIL